MSSDTRVQLSHNAARDISVIRSADARHRILKRLEALATFPRMGVVDEGLPQDHPAAERRITYAVPYAIRYVYDEDAGVVTVIAITDERIGSTVRFV